MALSAIALIFQSYIAEHVLYIIFVILSSLSNRFAKLRT